MEDAGPVGPEGQATEPNGYFATLYTDEEALPANTATTTGTETVVPDPGHPCAFRMQLGPKEVTRRMRARQAADRAASQIAATATQEAGGPVMSNLKELQYRSDLISG
jgi:hypothetical protein